MLAFGVQMMSVCALK